MTDMSKVCPRCGAGVRRQYNPAPGRHYWCGSKCAHGIGDLKPSRDCIPPLTPISPGDELGGERVIARQEGRDDELTDLLRWKTSKCVDLTHPKGEWVRFTDVEKMERENKAMRDFIETSGHCVAEVIAGGA